MAAASSARPRRGLFAVGATFMTTPTEQYREKNR